MTTDTRVEDGLICVSGKITFFGKQHDLGLEL